MLTKLKDKYKFYIDLESLFKSIWETCKEDYNFYISYKKIIYSIISKSIKSDFNLYFNRKENKIIIDLYIKNPIKLDLYEKISFEFED